MEGKLDAGSINEKKGREEKGEKREEHKDVEEEEEENVDRDRK